MHCIPITSKYTTIIRCTSLKNNRSYTVKCRCRNCDNQYGKRPISNDPESTLVPSRKRRKHTQQISVPKSAIFGGNVGEELQTILEYFILEGILHFLKQDYQTTPTITLNIYKAVVDIANSFQSSLPIGTKSEDDDILTFLREHKHNVEAFTALCHCQLTINLSTFSSQQQ